MGLILVATTIFHEPQAVDFRAEAQRALKQIGESTSKGVVKGRSTWPHQMTPYVKLEDLASVHAPCSLRLEILSCDDDLVGARDFGPPVVAVEPSPDWRDDGIEVPIACMRDGTLHLKYRIVRPFFGRDEVEPLTNVIDLRVPMREVETADQILSISDSNDDIHEMLDHDTKVTCIVVDRSIGIAFDFPEHCLQDSDVLGMQVEILDGQTALGTGRFWWSSRSKSRGGPWDIVIQVNSDVAAVTQAYRNHSMRVRISSSVEYALRDLDATHFWSGELVRQVDEFRSAQAASTQSSP